MTDYKIGLCDNCKGKDGIVNCDPNTCVCDCHYEIDELLRETSEVSRSKVL